MNETTWSPQRKIVGGAIALIVMVIVQAIFPTLEIPVGLEGAVTILAAYLLPDKKT